MTTLPTPISVSESYFDQELTLKEMSFWKEIPDDKWIDFAKNYLAQMEAGFTPQAIAKHVEGEKIRLYFEYLFDEDYDKEIERRYVRTPLLGHSPFPLEGVDYGGEGLTQALAPLRKHLLAADELYLPDNFYRCFDFVAESYDPTWKDNPLTRDGINHSIAAIQRWLPILAGLRGLITSGAIIFLPYYTIPSFPYAGGSTFMRTQMERLVIPRDPRVKDISESAGLDFSGWMKQPKIPFRPSKPAIRCETALYAWINARLLGLDPVFADDRTWQWATGIKFRDETKADFTTDLMSIDILPIGDTKNLSVQDIVSMRKGEQVFSHVRDTLIGCKEHVRTNVSESASRDFVSKVCREYIRDTLDHHERRKWLKFADNNFVSGTVLSVAIGAAFMTANPWVGLLVPAALTPKALLAVEGMFNPKIRAAVRLEALL